MRIIDIWDFEPETDLEVYLKYFFDTKPILFPPKNPLNFVEGVTGYTINRYNQFQTQLFIASPNTEIPDHIHPNVDSFEVAISGMTFRHSGEVIGTPETMQSGEAIYVAHNDWHGGVSSSTGGCFMSVQKWLNDVTPSSVERDWNGETMGNLHDSQILTKVSSNAA